LGCINGRKERPFLLTHASRSTQGPVLDNREDDAPVCIYPCSSQSAGRIEKGPPSNKIEAQENAPSRWQMLERETKREKNLETRAKELKIKAKKDQAKTETPLEGESVDDILKRVSYILALVFLGRSLLFQRRKYSM
jgi:hypothetical protein